MTILDQINQLLQERGVMTLREIYSYFPQTQPSVIRGIINRSLKKDDATIARCHRGIYSIKCDTPNNVIPVQQTNVFKRRSILSRFKQWIVKKEQKAIQTPLRLASGMETEQLDLFSSDIQSSESVEFSGLEVNASTGILTSNEPWFKTPYRSVPTKGYRSEAGQSIEFFDNRIFCEDSRDYLNHLPDESIDLVVTDPPYKITSRGCSGTTGGMMKTKESMKGNIFKHNAIKMKDYIPQLFRVLKEGTHCYLMTNHVNLVEMLNTAIESGFHFIKYLIWDKGNKIMGRAYMSQYEYILFFRKGPFKKINECGTSDLLSIPNKKTKENGKNLHDTEKPIELMKTLIRNSSQPGDRVLDPFMGIGSTAIAAKELGRTFLGNELDEVYHNICYRRLAETEFALG